MLDETTVQIVTELDIVAARQLGRNEAKAIGFNKVDQARIATAISELAKNIFLYASVGKIIIKRITKNGNSEKGIAIIAIDKGPWIKDVGKVLDYSPAANNGAGLHAVKRLVDLIEIQSEIGMGTIVRIEKWLR